MRAAGARRVGGARGEGREGVANSVEPNPLTGSGGLVTVGASPAAFIAAKPPSGVGALTWCSGPASSSGGSVFGTARGASSGRLVAGPAAMACAAGPGVGVALRLTRLGWMGRTARAKGSMASRSSLTESKRFLARGAIALWTAAQSSGASPGARSSMRAIWPAR